jgi:dTDP-4-dehydrorhamnose reductase
MATTTVLVTGASGVLGWHLCRLLDTAESLTVVGTFRANRPRFDRIHAEELDLANHSGFREVAQRGPYDVIVHTAALTNPDECERDLGRTRRVNVEATRRLVDLLSPKGRFIYTSTDLVFNGEKGGYSEEDLPDPVNRYGESKLNAEEIVRSAVGGVVVRIAKLYSNGSPFHPCFVTWMKERFEQGEELRLFRDQFRTPLYIGDAVRGLRRLFDGEPESDLYHLGGPERINRYDFGCRYADEFGYPLEQIRSVTMQEVGLVPRGADCSLESTRFSQEFAFECSGVVEGLRRLKSEFGQLKEG